MQLVILQDQAVVHQEKIDLGPLARSFVRFFGSSQGLRAG